MKQLKRLSMILSALSAIYPKTSNTLKVIGAILVLKKVVSLLISIYKTLLRPRINLAKRYGAGSWALVTGSSEGIGKAIAVQLARAGFNIVLSARTESKLQACRKEIISRYPRVQVLTLAVDYGKSGIPSFLQQALGELKDLNISILVNNVGVDVLEYYHKLSEPEILNLININCVACSLLSRSFIPRMLERHRNTGKRAAIINVASLAGEIPMPLHNVYSASKAFVDFLSRSLSYEYAGKIDILSLRPSEVSTPMTFNKKVDIMTIMPEDCARGMLNDLGHERVTNGHFSHSLQGALYHWVPERLFSEIFLRIVGPDFIKERQKASKKK